ncbi:MAG TPA: amidohydrolase family protein [Gammaproteobacteria bacterium]|nr:amidohydrolase family protein [Gammaproteobacteria bacterium]
MSTKTLVLTVSVTLAAGLSTAALAQPAPQPPSQPCPAVRDVLVTNGRIHTMDVADTVVDSVRIVGDRFAEVGTSRLPTSRCTRMIDLEGHTAVPGLIDNHNHIVLLGLRPGHDTRLESAASIGDVLAMLAARAAALPAGEWITSIGGFDINQFVPPPGMPRFPTLAELDSVTPNHPVFIQMSFSGPSVTNTLGLRFFQQKGIEIGADGAIAGGFQTPNPTTRALYELRQLQTLADQKRGTQDAMRYAASLGLTTHLDEGGFPATGTASDAAAHFDRYRAYDALLALYAEGALTQRIRLNFLHMETDAATPELVARLKNVFPHYGDDLLKVVGIGEFTAGSSPILQEASEVWRNGTRRVAEAGWRNENHSLTQGDFKVIIDEWTRLNASLPPPGIRNQRWVVAHAPFITQEYIDKLKALGGGVSVLGGWRYISGTAQQNGPPFKLLADSGIPIGMSSDGMQISPMNPWLGLYYVVTGKNARGDVINAGQTLPRAAGLRLYTAANGWFLGEEGQLGSIEPGKYADLAVLSADYFDSRAVNDEEIKRITSVLTVVGGQIVYGSPEAL